MRPFNFKSSSFELSVHQNIEYNHKNISSNCFQHWYNKMLINVYNVSWAANQHIRMISEGSCDTEDWRNDAENTAAHHRNKLHFKIDT